MSNLKLKIDQQLLYLGYNRTLFDMRYGIISKGQGSQATTEITENRILLFSSAKILPQFHPTPVKHCCLEKDT